MAINPANKSAAFAAQDEAYYKVDALIGGTAGMRAAGERLLPRSENEPLEKYKVRLSNTTLVNYYKRAIDAACGFVFAKPAEVLNVPEEIAPLLENIDGAGNTLEQFSQEAMWHAIHHGVAFLVADCPPAEKTVLTLAEQRQQSTNAYSYMITAPSVLAAFSAVDGSKERLVHFRWVGVKTTTDDFMDEKVVQVIHAYEQVAADDPVIHRQWEQTGGSWRELEPQVVTGVTEIPVVPVYGWKTGFCTGRPVLEDLADLNIAHWRSVSEQTNITSVARIAFIHVAGGDSGSPRTDDAGRVTPREAFQLNPHTAAITDADTTIKWIETSGSSMKLGAEDVAYWERKMDEMGLVPKTAKTGAITATESAINAAEANSQLRTIALSFSQAVSKLVELLAQFHGVYNSNPIISMLAQFEVQPAPADTTTP